MRSLCMRRMAGSGVRLLAAAVLALAIGAVEARANHVFPLSSVTFDDGTSATGTFTTNDGLNSLLTSTSRPHRCHRGLRVHPRDRRQLFDLAARHHRAGDGESDHIIELTFTGLTLPVRRS